jgi:hypothetical protein
VYLDGEYQGRVTPVTLTGLAPGTHTLRLEMDDFKPSEQVVDIRENTAVHVNMTSIHTGYAKLLRGYDESQNGVPDRSGGVYVESYPEGAEILVDGKETGLATISVVFGLKEGAHTIRVRLEHAGFPVDQKKVWVYPGTLSRVSFDVAPVMEREVRVDSEEFRKAEFTVNGRYPVYRVPREVTLDDWRSFVTVHDNGSFLSFPADGVDSSGTLTLTREEVPLTTVLVRSNPRGADILIDGFSTGLATPSVVRNLSAGRHRVLVSTPGYVPQELEITQVDLPGEGPDQVMDVFLETYPHGALTVESTPPGAKIFLFQRDTGATTPHTFPYLKVGTYEVKLESASDSQTLSDVTVTPYGNTRVHANLTET